MHSIRKERAVKGLPAAIAILLICSSFLIQGASTHIPPSFSQRGAIYYVATYGNDSNPGTAAQPWRTIQHAANVMVAGDTVFVRGASTMSRCSPPEAEMLQMVTSHFLPIRARG